MKRTRSDIISIVGREFLTTNIENGEWSYPQAFKVEGISPPKWIKNKAGREFNFIDLRFVNENISVLIETKKNYDTDKEAEKQLQAYVKYEKELSNNKIVAILANTENERGQVHICV